MRKTVWLSLALGLTLGVARAQSEGVVSVDLGMGIAGPGEHALVPVTLSAGRSGRVGRIFLEVSFPRQFLSFNSVLKTTTTESLQLDINTELQETGEEERNCLGKETSKKILPSRPAVPVGWEEFS